MFVALVPLVLLLTRALLPNHNPILYWPVGLAAAIVFLYFVCIYTWATHGAGLTATLAKWDFVLLATSACICAVLRRPRESRVQIVQLTTFSKIVVVGGTIVTAAIGVNFFLNNQVSMIGSYLAGGDHNHHVEYVTGLIAGAGHRSFSNPFNPVAYPMGIHFLISHLYAADSALAGVPDLARRHLIPAMFEYVQLAAVVNLYLLVIVRQCRERKFLPGVISLISLGALFSVHKLFNHLFWSGFTTSLGLTWLVLLAIAVPWHELGSVSAASRFSSRALVFFVLTTATWFIYQPFVLIPAAVTGAVVVRSAVSRFGPTRFRVWKQWNTSSLAIAAALLVLAALVPLVIQGKSSPSLQSLVQWGVCWHINQAILKMGLLVAGGALFIRRKKESAEWHTQATILMLFTAMTVTLGAVAAYVSPNFTLQSEPYYIQKMFWILFILSSVVATSQLVGVVTESERRLTRAPSIALLLLAIGACGMLYTRASSAVQDRIRIDWFAADMYGRYTTDELRHSAVFNTWENLGAHVGNIAIMDDSDLELDGDIPFSQKPEWACWQMRNDHTKLIFTETGQGLDLVKAGCDQFATYIESGVRVDRLVLPSPAMVIGKTVKTNSRTNGPRFLLAGFESPEDSYTWATGFHSTAQMIAPTNLQAATLKLSLLRSWVPDTLVVNLYSNSRLLKSQSLRAGQESVVIRFGAVKQGDAFRFELDCSRSYEAAANAAQNGNNRRCVALRSFRIEQDRGPLGP